MANFSLIYHQGCREGTAIFIFMLYIATTAVLVVIVRVVVVVVVVVVVADTAAADATIATHNIVIGSQVSPT